MDSMKLEIYIAILNEFKKYKGWPYKIKFNFICSGFRHFLYKFGYYANIIADIEDKDLKDLFPEFFELCDDRLYDHLGGFLDRTIKEECHAPWWSIGYVEARISTLEFIIANRLG